MVGSCCRFCRTGTTCTSSCNLVGVRERDGGRERPHINSAHRFSEDERMFCGVEGSFLFGREREGRGRS
jgi:hypothetical protein